MSLNSKEVSQIVSDWNETDKKTRDYVLIKFEFMCQAMEFYKKNKDKKFGESSVSLTCGLDLMKSHKDKKDSLFAFLN